MTQVDDLNLIGAIDQGTSSSRFLVTYFILTLLTNLLLTFIYIKLNSTEKCFYTYLKTKKTILRLNATNQLFFVLSL